MKLTDFVEAYIKYKSYPFEAQDDDSKVDKLSRKFTAIVVFLFSILLGVVNVVGNPINCWCLGEFKSTRCKYAKTYCYVTGTYVPLNNSTELPRRDELLSHRIQYYQWVPYIFLLQSFMFYFPHILCIRSGYELKNYIKILRADDSDIENSNAVKYVVSHMKSCIDYHKNYERRGHLSLRFIFKNGTYLSTCYFLIKFLYGLIAFAQLYLLNYWLRDTYYSNLSIYETIFGNHNFRLSERFPRMTLCRFHVYLLTDDQVNWIQCALPVNIYIEKMYLILWSWLWILLFIIIFDIFKFMIQFLRSTSFIYSRLNELNPDQKEHISKILTKDFVLALRLVRSNTNEFYVNAILSNLARLLKIKNISYSD